MKYEKAWSNKKAWKLYQENWKLCHDFVDLRDGHVCMIPGCGREEVDLDHAITRKRKILFFDVRHLGYLCRGEGGHHANKSFRNGDWVDKKVDGIHRKREGDVAWDEILSMAYRDCPQFRSVLWQEQINLKLKELLALMNSETRAV